MEWVPKWEIGGLRFGLATCAQAFGREEFYFLKRPLI